MKPRYVILDDSKMGARASVFKSSLCEKIISQDDAVREIVQIYQTYLAGMCMPERPVGSFLFLGPSGTGKTKIVEAVGESLFGSAKVVIKVDCAEFAHSHEIAKLLGSPPGYLGHRETVPLLTQERLNECHTEKLKLSLVLFDEIEKAHGAFWNLLLGILDKAILTLGDNRRVNFERTIVFMTGNLGSREIDNILSPSYGFEAGIPRPAGSGKKLGEQISKAGTEAARKKFTPEFLNRIDKVVIFRPFGEESLRRILALELNAVKHQVAQSGAVGGSFDFTLSPEAENFLLEKGTNPRFGARHIKRAIQNLLVNPLATLIATNQIRKDDNLIIDVNPEREKLYFMREEEEGERPRETRRRPRNTSPPAPEQEMAAEAAAAGGAHD